MDEHPKKPLAEKTLPLVPDPNRGRAEFGELLEEAARISFETGNDAYERALGALGISPGDPRHPAALRVYQA
jgi:hypothetical protein